MGTRHVTMVIKEEKPVVSQYGQWDGYPSGQGLTVLRFLKTRSLNKFKKKLELVHLATDEDIKELEDWFKSIGVDDGWMTSDQANLFHQKYPLLTRDNGAEILFMLQDNKEKVFLQEANDFAHGKDGGFGCEWVYVIDLDKNELQVHDGSINVIPTKTYSLDKLPAPKKFCKDLEYVEEDN